MEQVTRRFAGFIAQERDTRLFDVHLKCAVSPVCVFLTNALRSHYACGLECGGFINVRCEPHYRRLLLS